MGALNTAAMCCRKEKSQNCRNREATRRIVDRYAARYARVLLPCSYRTRDLLTLPCSGRQGVCQDQPGCRRRFHRHGCRWLLCQAEYVLSCLPLPPNNYDNRQTAPPFPLPFHAAQMLTIAQHACSPHSPEQHPRRWRVSRDYRRRTDSYRRRRSTCPVSPKPGTDRERTGQSVDLRTGQDSSSQPTQRDRRRRPPPPPKKKRAYTKHSIS